MDKTLKLWDADTGTEIVTLVGHTRPVFSCSFSPDGEFILSGSRDRTMKIWDAMTGKEIRTLSGYMDSIRACSFSPDGRSIVSESEDGFLKLWDEKTGNLLCEYGTEGSLLGVSWGPDGKTIVAGDKVGRIHLLGLENMEVYSPIVTSWVSPADSIYAFGCPVCRKWNIIPGQSPGKVLQCCKCSNSIKINPFSIKADWRNIEKTWLSK
jgi:WD40 repeat protein